MTHTYMRKLLLLLLLLLLILVVVVVVVVVVRLEKGRGRRMFSGVVNEILTANDKMYHQLMGIPGGNSVESTCLHGPAWVAKVNTCKICRTVATPGWSNINYPQ